MIRVINEDEKQYHKYITRKLRNNINKNEIILGIKNDEIYNSIAKFLRKILIEYDINTDIVDFEIVGSRSKRTQNENSDLDIILEYNNDKIREDDMFNLLNSEDYYINGIKVDFNPINPLISGYTVTTWLKNNYNYDKLGEKKSEHEKFLKKHGIKPEGYGIGFSESENAWYGWTHRGIYGFKIGDIVKKGDVVVGTDHIRVGFKAKTLDDCKKLAKAYSKALS